MAEVSTFRSTLLFFDKLGIYDVILPFLLVFTAVFAIMEKTRIYGTETIDGVEYSKKNLNAMTAFVVAFLTVASSQIVAVINQTAAHVVILLLVSIFFLMLAGSFMKESKESYYLEGAWKWIFMTIMFIGVIFIFLNALQTSSGTTWLSVIGNWLLNINNSTVVSSLVMIIVFVLLIWFITKGADQGGSKSNNGNSE